ncbi:MAG: helix-turn-helix domain-containing protein, partial [Bacilli bacterium]
MNGQLSSANITQYEFAIFLDIYIITIGALPSKGEVKMNTINIYKKHLTLTQRIKIENGLNNNKSFRKISLDIDKAHNTISREVLQRRTKVKGNSFNTLIMECPKTKKAPF